MKLPTWQPDDRLVTGGILKDRLRPEKVPWMGFRTGVRLPSPPPNKVDSFDTIGIETINLFLFAKMLVAQGFSAYHHFGIVSLWDLCRCFPLLKQPFMCQTQSHAETFL